MERGSLWHRVEETARQALKTGALLSVPTKYTFIEEQGVRFFVRVLESLKRKDEARKKQESQPAPGRKVNPFLPPEPDLTVAEITGNHIAVLNKFNVLEHHLLIVTRHFEDQKTLLTPGDFEALWFCLSEYKSLGFYNGGKEAGASQEHKHLQLVPLPLAPGGPTVPIDPFIAQAPASREISSIPAFPFLNAFVRLDPDRKESSRAAAGKAYNHYCSMLKQLGMEPPAPSGLIRQSMPYCLLATQEWMLIVPRTREFFEEISLNSLAFAGSFFVRDQGQLERLKSYGLMNALRAVAVERAIQLG